MRVREMKIGGARLVELDKHTDGRGFFARAWCARELGEQDLETTIVQANISHNDRAGTVRGMHFQRRPFEEAKYVRCTKGKIYDVIVDLRPESATYRQWEAVELSARNYNMLYIPRGIAHGFQTLEDDSEILYLHTEYFDADSASGIRWDDPLLDIRWPIEDGVTVSEKDCNWPLLDG